MRKTSNGLSPLNEICRFMRELYIDPHEPPPQAASPRQPSAVKNEETTLGDCLISAAK